MILFVYYNNFNINCSKKNEDIEIKWQDEILFHEKFKNNDFVKSLEEIIQKIEKLNNNVNDIKNKIESIEEIGEILRIKQWIFFFINYDYNQFEDLNNVILENLNSEKFSLSFIQHEIEVFFNKLYKHYTALKFLATEFKNNIIIQYLPMDFLNLELK